VVAAIPGAKFVALESRNHLLLETEPAWQVFLTEVRAFLGVEVGPPATPLQAPPASYPDGLTAREIDVLRLIAQGNRNAQIGEALFISAKTVAQHVTGILAKTGSSNRAEAATYAAWHGLV
jgi:DNA-binding CsgD family transcriptional regulator